MKKRAVALVKKIVEGDERRTSVATKIKNGPKTKTKNLRVQKKDRRQRRRFFGILKNLQRPSKMKISSKIFEDSKISASI